MTMHRLFFVLGVAALLLGASDEMAEKIRRQNMNVVAAAAESLSKELPKKVDPFTKLTEIRAEGEKLLYLFEVDAGPKSDEQLVREGKERMTCNVTAGVCSTSARFLKSGIVIVYRYLSARTKRPLFDVVVSKESCPFLEE